MGGAEHMFMTPVRIIWNKALDLCVMIAQEGYVTESNGKKITLKKGKTY